MFQLWYLFVPREGVRSGVYQVDIRGGNLTSSHHRGKEVNGSYELRDGTEYAVCLYNDLMYPSDCLLKIDGKSVGRFRLEKRGWYPITRPINDQRRFLFVAVDESNGEEGNRHEEGTIEAMFIPSEEAASHMRNQRSRSRSRRLMSKMSHDVDVDSNEVYNESSSSSSSSCSSIFPPSLPSPSVRVGRTTSGSNSD